MTSQYIPAFNKRPAVNIPVPVTPPKIHFLERDFPPKFDKWKLTNCGKQGVRPRRAVE